jgi:glyoxylase-like metal-dependent hydrolase (beta-lactamase superfamily II)
MRRLVLVALALVACKGDDAPVDGVRIYAVDCGAIELTALEVAANAGEGQSPVLVDVCYLIRHPRGTMLWDLGLGDDLAEKPGGTVDERGVHLQVERPMLDQLAEIGIGPGQIDYLAFSHVHFDHTGNANRFPMATWIVNRRELAWGTATPTPFGVNPASWSLVRSVKTEIIDGDHDVFGDGSVRILAAPGHTPGHQVLLVSFPQGGAVLLGGDLYQTRDNVRTKHVPAVNVSREETLSSFERIDRVLAETRATLVVQHAPEDLAGLPKFPSYLD